MIIVLGSEKLSLVEVERFWRPLGAWDLPGTAGRRSRVGRRRCFDIRTQTRRGKGLIRACMERMTGLSRAQCTRLIGQYRKAGRIATGRSRRRNFPRRYTAEDVAALAQVDQAHERMSGLATRCNLQAHLVMESNRSLRLVLRLENAPKPHFL